MKRRKCLALLLTLAMLAGMVQYPVFVQANADDTNAGLVITSCLDWDNEGNITGCSKNDEDLSFAGDDYMVEMPSSFFALFYRYKDAASNQWKYEQLNPSQVRTKSISGSAIVETKDNDYFLISSADNTAITEISYTVNNTTYTVNVCFMAPEIGFYLQKDEAGVYNSIIQGDIQYDGETVIYARLVNRFNRVVKLADTTNLLNNFKVDGGSAEDYIDVEQISVSNELGGESWYKVTIKADNFRDFNIEAIANSFNMDDVNDVSQRQAGIGARKCGMVSCRLDEQWNEESQENEYVLPPQPYYDSVQYGTVHQTMGIQLGYTLGGEVEPYTDVLPSDLILKVKKQAGYEVVSDVTLTVTGAGFIVIPKLDEGTYQIGYQDRTTILQIELPDTGFFKTNNRTQEAYMDEGYIYSKTDKNEHSFYFLTRDYSEGMDKISDVTFGTDFGMGAIEAVATVEEVVKDKCYKITVAADNDDNFNIFASYKRTNGVGNSWTDKYYIDVNISDKSYEPRESSTDNAEELGFMGCFISRQEFASGQMNWNIETPIYWVHGKSMQEVADKLSALTASNTIVKTKYIHIEMKCQGRYQANIEKDQTVTTGDDIEGVQIESGLDEYKPSYPSDCNSGNLAYNARVYRATKEFTAGVMTIPANTYYTMTSDHGACYVEWDKDLGEYVILLNKVNGNYESTLYPQQATQSQMEEINEALIDEGNDAIEILFQSTYQLPKLTLDESADYTVNGVMNKDITVSYHSSSKRTIKILSSTLDNNYYRLGFKEYGAANGGQTIPISGKYAYYNYKSGSCVVDFATNLNVKKIEDPVPVTLTSISIIKAPQKTAYVEGEVFQPTGMVVQANYSDGTKKLITLYTYSKAALTTAMTSIAITYQGKTVQQAITVKSKVAVGDVVTQSKLSYSISNTKKNTVTLLTIKASATGTVMIPATIKANGKTYKVTAISANALNKCKKVKTIIMGNNVSKIGKQMFKNFKKLKKIVIKTTLLTSKSVAKNAMKGIAKSVKIQVPKKKLKAYKKLLRAKGLSSKNKIYS